MLDKFIFASETTSAIFDSAITIRRHTNCSCKDELDKSKPNTASAMCFHSFKQLGFLQNIRAQIGVGDLHNY